MRRLHFRLVGALKKGPTKMSMKTGAAVIAAVLLSGCGTMAFTPTEYPLRAGLIAERPVNGTVSITNGQPSSDQAIVYNYGGSKLATTYNAITQLMVDQASGELAKAATTSSGPAKTIDLKVTALKSTYIAFFWKSEMKYTAVLGGAKTLEKVVNHGTGGGVHQNLNGSVADAVVDLLNDPAVLAYLAE